MVAAARSVTDLIAEIRQRSDQENSTFVSGTELEGWLNQSAADLHDLIVDHAGTDAFEADHTFTTTPGTDVYALPADFYRLASVTARLGGRWRALRASLSSERTRFEGASLPRYALAGRTTAGVAELRLVPAPTSAVQICVWYVPLAFDAVIPASLVSFNGWDEYVICDVCAKVAEKEESDSRAFLARRDRAAERITKAATRLDMGEPLRMRDVADEVMREDDEPLGLG